VPSSTHARPPVSRLKEPRFRGALAAAALDFLPRAALGGRASGRRIESQKELRNDASSSVRPPTPPVPPLPPSAAAPPEVEGERGRTGGGASGSTRPQAGRPLGLGDAWAASQFFSPWSSVGSGRSAFGSVGTSVSTSAPETASPPTSNRRSGKGAAFKSLLKIDPPPPPDASWLGFHQASKKGCTSPCSTSTPVTY